MAVTATAWIALGLSCAAGESARASGRADSPRAELRLGLGLSYFDYAEELVLPDKSEESGLLYALRAEYEQPLGQSFWLSAGFEASPSTTRYDGSSSPLGDPSAPAQPFTTTTHNLFLDSSLAAGARILRSESGSLSLYGGIGFRYWRRGVGEVRDGVASLREDYRWFYSLIGVRFEQRATESITWGLDAALRPMFGGRMQVELSKFFTVDSDPTLELGDRLGWSVRLPVRARVSPDVEMVFAPWYQRSGIQQSDPVLVTIDGTPSQVLEPSSTTHQFGLATSVVFGL